MLNLPSYIAGAAASGDQWIEVFNPWNNERVGRVATIGRAQLDNAIQAIPLRRTR